MTRNPTRARTASTTHRSSTQNPLRNGHPEAPDAHAISNNERMLCACGHTSLGNLAGPETATTRAKETAA